MKKEINYLQLKTITRLEKLRDSGKMKDYLKDDTYQVHR